MAVYTHTYTATYIHTQSLLLKDISFVLGLAKFNLSFSKPN